MKTVLAVILSHPNQHFSPALKVLAAHPEITLQVFYASIPKNAKDEEFGKAVEWDVPLLDGYPWTELARNLPSRDLLRHLKQLNPDAVLIFGYAQKINWTALIWAKARRKRVLFLSDAELLHFRSASKKLLKKCTVPWFFRLCDRFITVGDQNEAYYRHFGVADKKLVRGCIPIDTNRFRRMDSKRRELRDRFGLSEGGLLLVWCGKLVERKRPLDFLRAFALLKEEFPQLKAVFVGEGALRKQIEEQIHSQRLVTRVFCAGFINQKEMPGYLSAADALVLTSSQDAHPLVVTEAMACGAAAIVSDRIGCVGPSDVLRPGKNGLVYECGNTRALSEQIRLLCSNSALLEAYQRSATEVARAETAERWVQAVVDSLK